MLFGSLVAAFYSFDVAFNISIKVSFCVFLINGNFRRFFSRLLGLSIAFRLPFAYLVLISRLSLTSLTCLRPMTSNQVYTLYIVFSL
jgi:hypothetical protein